MDGADDDEVVAHERFRAAHQPGGVETWVISGEEGVGGAVAELHVGAQDLGGGVDGHGRPVDASEGGVDLQLGKRVRRGGRVHTGRRREVREGGVRAIAHLANDAIDAGGIGHPEREGAVVGRGEGDAYLFARVNGLAEAEARQP